MTEMVRAGRDGGDKLSRLSRTAIGFSAVLLALAFVVPVWRINLVAPQYPEGLGMLIRINTITGMKPADLDNINGLNHYIGMKTIVPDAIPVLRIMPFVLGVLVVFGLAVAFYGRRWSAIAWLATLGASGIAGMYEFWKWSYDYGHNLAADAIIKIPGMTYQPPLIGTKQLLNFTASSWPAAGAMIAGATFVIAAAAILLSRRNTALLTAVTIAGAAVAPIALPTTLNAQAPTVLVSEKGVTLGRAMQLIAPHGTITVLPGRYIVHALVINKPVTITGQGFPTIDGGGTTEVIRVSSNDVTITGVRITGTGVSYTQDRAAIRVSNSTNCNISGNRIDHTLYGIYLANVTGCHIERNTLTGSGKTEARSGNGIHLWSSREITIANNQVRGYRDGIYFEFVHNTTVTRNVSEQNLRYGLHFMYSDDCEYIMNTFRQNGAGVAVMYTKRVHMAYNRFEHNWGSSAYGLLLKEIDNSRIDHNVFEENTVGMFADGADHIRATGNDFVRNGWAVKVSGSTLDGMFSGNNFRDNTFDVTTNSRDPSTKFVGNYWSSYSGYDLDRDGVGDVPYAPVRLFAVIVERNPQAVILMRSILSAILDAAERAMPALTPELFVDPRPSMRSLG